MKSLFAQLSVATSLLLIILVPLTGCAKTTEGNSTMADYDMTVCTEPRPEMCTMNYDPVCAELKDGSVKTYSNGCNACSDPQVVGYRKGECK